MWWLLTLLSEGCLRSVLQVNLHWKVQEKIMVSLSLQETINIPTNCLPSTKNCSFKLLGLSYVERGKNSTLGGRSSRVVQGAALERENKRKTKKIPGSPPGLGTFKKKSLLFIAFCRMIAWWVLHNLVYQEKGAIISSRKRELTIWSSIVQLIDLSTLSQSSQIRLTGASRAGMDIGCARTAIRFQEVTGLSPVGCWAFLPS